jgi:hypothetical protein
MKNKLSTLALVVLVALVAFACGTMVTTVEAQSSRTYIGTCCYGPRQVGSTFYGARVFVVYEENGVIVKKDL